MRRITIATVVLASAPLVGVAACSVTNLLDTAKAEQEIQKGIQEQAGIPVTVTCPDDVTAKKGDVFQCIASDSSGGKITVQVTQDDDQGNVSWKVISSGSSS